MNKKYLLSLIAFSGITFLITGYSLENRSEYNANGTEPVSKPLKNISSENVKELESYPDEFIHQKMEEYHIPGLAIDQTHNKIAKIVEAEAKYNLFSGVVLVAKSGQIIYSQGIGDANKEYNIPNVLETRFNIGSIEKCFTATIIMQLVQEGKVNLSDPLSRFFPDCPYATADSIQIKHLLNHTAGLGDYRSHKEYQALADTTRSIAEVMPFVFQQKPEFNPGKRWTYSNTGYLFLKAIIEKTDGVLFKDALEQRILHPLGMYNTILFSKGELLTHRASGYSYTNDGNSFVRAVEEPSAYTGGGIYTTVLDLLKFDQALYDGGLLSEPTKEIMFKPVDPSKQYGYGWIVMRFGGGRAIYHGGQSDGFSAEFRRYPETRYSVIVLSNYSGDAAFELANKIDNMLFGYPYELATKYDLNVRLGDHYKHKKDYKMALSFFEKNLQDTENIHFPSLFESANARILGRFELQKAIEQIDLYTKLSGDNVDIMRLATLWGRLGEAYEHLGNIKVAVQCYKKIRKIDPNYPELEKTITRLEGISN